ncbi:uncharacterized protein LOC128557021 [Mercenaria mercenaria]|uniref:uncharacterized protein LOC128557021 n=1 Tax=Mercenaria mercenaria TaxID=6596 RepID=UPI00234E8A7C|nr:uncharacterized protein LOC128557021 [Mercenaria mercenaria]
MDSWEKSAVWKVISFVKKNDIKNAKPLCKEAIRQFEDIDKRINLNVKSKISLVKTFIENVASGQQKSAQKQIDHVSELFETHIKPYLEEEERTLRKMDGGTRKVDTKGADTRQNREHVEGFNSKEIAKGPIERGTKGLIQAFKGIYKHGSWNAAFQVLKAMRGSEQLSIECLLVIVQKAFDYCKEESSTQVNTAEECARLIVKDGQLPRVKPKLSNDTPVNDLLLRYRYIHAELAVDRLQKAFLKTILEHLDTKYNIRIGQESAVERFIQDCMEVTWLMCVEDPPIYMHPLDAKNIDEKKYELEKRGKTCIVWPALQVDLNGPVVAKGVAWYK